MPYILRYLDYCPWPVFIAIAVTIFLLLMGLTYGLHLLANKIMVWRQNRRLDRHIREYFQ